MRKIFQINIQFFKELFPSRSNLVVFFYTFNCIVTGKSQFNISANLIEPCKGSKPRMFMTRFPMNFPISLQRLQKIQESFIGKYPYATFLVCCLPSEVSFNQNLIHQFYCQFFFFSLIQTAGRIRKSQIKTEHFGGNNGKFFQTKHAARRSEFFFPECFVHFFFHKHHPVNHLTKTKSAF